MALHAARRGADDALDAPALDAVARQLDAAALAVDDLERAAAGREPGLRPAPVDLPALLADQAAAWRPVARSAGRALVVAAAPRLVLHADGHLLARALGNLLANAVEHGAGAITVAARRRGGRLRLEVRDAGAPAAAPGSDPGPRDAGARSTPPGGTHPGPPRPRRPCRPPWPAHGVGARRPRRRPAPAGHGLRVAADAAARHGGRLLVVRDGGGTAAILELPLPRPGPHRAGRRVAAAAPSRRRRRRCRPAGCPA